MPSAVPKPGESLADLFPDVAAQWHPTRNGELSPLLVKAGSNRKCWWLCPEGPDHEWLAKPNARTGQGTGCPCCRGLKISDSNRLSILCPSITAQWHPTKNGTLTPDQVVAGTSRNVWWKCSKGTDHEWQATVQNRTLQGQGCPFCSGRRASEGDNLEVWCSANGVDGAAVLSRWHPVKNGHTRPSDVRHGSKTKVWWRCLVAVDHEWHAMVNSQTSGVGCPFCAGKKVSSTNSLQAINPELADQWHPSKNGDLDPSDVVAGTHRKVWWECKKGPNHEWEAAVGSRNAGGGCPYCRGIGVSVTKSVATQRPDLAKQWHPTRNLQLNANEVSVGSRRRVWWMCPEGPDHEWQASVRNRVALDQGCPYCVNKRVAVSNSLEGRFPEISAELHPTRNGDLDPSRMLAGDQRKKVWWSCPEGPDHEWFATPHTRTVRDSHCPACSGHQLSVTNSLGTWCSEHPGLGGLLLAEWHAIKNGARSPHDVRVRSSGKVWWKCPEGPDHEWQAPPNERIEGHGCPACHGLQVSITNCLSTVNPEASSQWHPARNGDLTPDDVVSGSPKKAWWMCLEGPDHEWQATISSRARAGRGCPYCNGKYASVTNSLEALFPTLASQWHPSSNGDLCPGDVVAKGNRRVWWQCPVDEAHEWPATVGSRSLGGNGCPLCTLTPRSAQEIRLAHELAALIDFDLDLHKVRFGGRLRDVDIVLEDLSIVVEFDGAYWHRNKVDKDRDKTTLIEEADWEVIRVRERPLDSIHTNDVMADALAPAKTVADLVLNKIVEVTGAEIPRLDEYLASDDAWREAEALTAIRSYLAERAAKKAARTAKKQ